MSPRPATTQTAVLYAWSVRRMHAWGDEGVWHAGRLQRDLRRHLTSTRLVQDPPKSLTNAATAVRESVAVTVLYWGP